MSASREFEGNKVVYPYHRRAFLEEWDRIVPMTMIQQYLDEERCQKNKYTRREDVMPQDKIENSCTSDLSFDFASIAEEKEYSLKLSNSEQLEEHSLEKSLQDAIDSKFNEFEIQMLADYYDPDYLLSLTSRSSSRLKEMRPILRSSLHLLDDLIAMLRVYRKTTFLLQECRVARYILLVRYLQPSASSADLNFADDTTAKPTGISEYVWSYIKNQHCSANPESLEQQQIAQQSDFIRKTLQVYGTKVESIQRETRDNQNVLVHSESLYPSAFQQFGQRYLHSISPQNLERPTISVNEWKILFQYVMNRIQRLYPAFNVYPCGVFARGAPVGSVLDILVEYPSIAGGHEQQRERIVGALSGDTTSLFSATDSLGSRYLGILQYEAKRVLLDMKMYAMPQSSFALTYFTGPENFACKIFEKLVHHVTQQFARDGTQELPSTRPDFKSIYEYLAKICGTQRLQAVLDEKDVFELVTEDYIPPGQRF